ncbi:helicase associated domain-containing protein [Streptomyces sp. NPDC005498]|uniref:helicase associated domain-containing protein n=1 Tax=Streptomyces sp. NPDC005498 TaxID=3364717 RepID=UPI0036826A36
MSPVTARAITPQAGPLAESATAAQAVETWGKHDAAWRARLTTVTDYHCTHGHLAIPCTTPTGAP